MVTSIKRRLWGSVKEGACVTQKGWWRRPLGEIRLSEGQGKVGRRTLRKRCQGTEDLGMPLQAQEDAGKTARMCIRQRWRSSERKSNPSNPIPRVSCREVGTRPDGRGMARDVAC